AAIVFGESDDRDRIRKIRMIEMRAEDEKAPPSQPLDDGGAVHVDTRKGRMGRRDRPGADQPVELSKDGLVRHELFRCRNDAEAYWIGARLSFRLSLVSSETRSQTLGLRRF